MDFGRTGQRASGESGFEHVHRRHAIQQYAFDVADDVHDVAIALDGEGFGHLDRANFGDAANVVAGQINQHDVLGTLFGVVDELGFGGIVRLWICTSRTRTSEWANGDFLGDRAVNGDSFLPDQDFWTRTNDMEIAKVVVIHIRRRIQRTQGAVEAERGLGVTLFDALANLDLHEIAAGNQLFGAQHGGEVVDLGKVAHSGVGG